jgi:hypothetical protein
MGTDTLAGTGSTQEAGVRLVHLDKYHPGYFWESWYEALAKRNHSFLPHSDPDKLETLGSEQTPVNAVKTRLEWPNH